MKRDIDDIVKDEIIDKIDNTITITSVTPLVDDMQTVTFCDMKYLGLYTSFSFDGFDYTIVSIVDEDVTVTVLGGATTLAVGDIATIAIPHYYRGTRRAVNTEWKAFSDDERDKLPMVWLTNPVRETFFRNKLEERKSEIRLFLLCSADFENDLTKDFREKNIVPLMALKDSIWDSINANNVNFKKLDEVETVDFSKFGVEEKTGMIKAIIDSNLSGVDVKFGLEVLNQNCINC